MVPLNARFDGEQIANPMFRTIHELVANAVSSDSFRFDGSDQMPPGIGGERGAFLRGMLRLFREGTVDNAEQLAAEIAADIESTGAALESDDKSAVNRRYVGTHRDRFTQAGQVSAETLVGYIGTTAQGHRPHFHECSSTTTRSNGDVGLAPCASTTQTRIFDPRRSISGSGR